MPVDIRAVNTEMGQWVAYATTNVSIQPVENFVLGETKPTASNVGYVAGTTFTIVNGNQTYSTDNQVIENRRFTGKVSVTGKNITFRNCWFNAASTNSNTVQVTNTNAQNIMFDRCTFRPSSFSSTINCVFGHDFTLYRCDVSGGVDGVDVYRSSTGGALNVSILGTWIHDLGYWSPDSSHADNQSHNDLIQIHYGGTDLHIMGCRLDGTADPTVGNANEPSVDDANGTHLSGNKYYPLMTAMSVVMASPVSTTAGLTNFIFEQNWADGGQVMINWPRSDGTNIQIINNRWGHNTLLGDTYTILAQAAQPMTITGNYYEDTATPYNGRRNG